MTLKIAICDDDLDYLHELKEIIVKYQFHANVDITFTLFEDGLDLVKAYEQNNTFDIVLLDIEMKNTNGIEIAKLLKSKHSSSIYLIFISNYPKYMLDSFDAHPYYFINKPISQDKIFQLINDIIDDINNNNIYKIIVNTDSSSFVIDIREIYSIETIATRKNYCLLKTKNQSLECRGTISDWNNKLITYGFVQCHRCCIVNLRYIHYITKNEVILNNSSKLPLSKTGHKLINTNYL